MGTAPTTLTDALTREQEDPAVASDGSAFLVVWDDGDELGADKDIKGGRVNSSGARIGTVNGFSISAATGAQTDAVVAYNGNYLVVWNDGRSGNGMYANQVTKGGNVKNGTGFEVSGGNNEGFPNVATPHGANTAVNQSASFSVVYASDGSIDVRGVTLTVASK